MNNFWFITLLSITTSCSQREIKGDALQNDSISYQSFSLLSNHVKDTFKINVSVPDSALVDSTGKFPVIFVLDANLYFDIYASILQKYSEVGLLPPAILIGVGYSDFQKMDSLRQRDYTFPVGLPEYEMPVSGKANFFLKFLQKELIPEIDKRYCTDTKRRFLIGHSLGGYFSMYAFLQEMRENENQFAGFIAASPSLHFNHNFLPKQFDSLTSVNVKRKKLYISFGQLENSEMESGTTMNIDNLFKQLTRNLSRFPETQIKTVQFSDLDHMDTQIPTFTKGVQWIITR